MTIEEFNRLSAEQTRSNQARSNETCQRALEHANGRLEQSGTPNAGGIRNDTPRDGRHTDEHRSWYKSRFGNK